MGEDLTEKGALSARRYAASMTIRELLDEYEQASHMVGFESHTVGNHMVDFWTGSRDEIRGELDQRLEDLGWFNE
jgi:hypothetical protein